MHPDSIENQHSSWPEFLFSLGMVIVGLAFAYQASQAVVDEEGINARTLPLVTSALVTLFGAWRSILLAPDLRGRSWLSSFGNRPTVSVFVQICLEMILYVWLIQAVGYLAGTALTMFLVLWTFGSRNYLLNLVLAVTSGIVASLLFDTLLKMYFPDGWIWPLIFAY